MTGGGAWQVVPFGAGDLAATWPHVAPAFAGERDADDLLALVGADDPFKDHVVRLRVDADGSPAGVAVGHLEGATAYLDLVGVRPALQGRGIGRALLAGFEARAVALGARSASIGGSARRFAWPGVSMVRTPAIALALRHGYRRAHVLFDMWVDLAAPVAPSPRTLERLGREGVTFRLATEADVPALRRAARQVQSGDADGDGAGGVWPDELTAGVRGARSGVYVATVEGAIQAFAGFSVYRSTMFGPTGTAEALRGRGIGEVLLRLALDAIRRQGSEHAEIGWIADEALPFYSRTVGATCGAAYWVLTKPLPSADRTA